MDIQEVLPEEVVLATLHCVGDVRIANDARLARIFDEAAVEYPTLYGRFRAHPVYQHSKRLDDVLQRLDLGGALVRENAPSPALFFRATQRTVGDYGAGKLNLIPEQQQAAVKQIAWRIREQFARSDARPSGAVRTSDATG